MVSATIEINRPIFIPSERSGCSSPAEKTTVNIHSTDHSKQPTALRESALPISPVHPDWTHHIRAGATVTLDSRGSLWFSRFQTGSFSYLPTCNSTQLKPEKPPQPKFDFGGINAIFFSGRHEHPDLTFPLVLWQDCLRAIPIQLR